MKEPDERPIESEMSKAEIFEAIGFVVVAAVIFAGAVIALALWTVQ